MQCTAQRVTLTLAPNGRWRGRTAYLENDPKKAAPVVEQGCWDATDERPPRVILLDGQGNVRVEFVVAANNVLRVRSVAGQTPNLNYNLTRQPDLDPIDELAKAKAPSAPEPGRADPPGLNRRPATTGPAGHSVPGPCAFRLAGTPRACSSRM